MARVRQRFEWARDLVQSTIVWRVWERMLETEFVDRSVALAGKAFVSFFPLVIVVAAFLPARMRASIFASLTNRLGISGNSLDLARSAFQSADDVKRATGLLGLVTTFFFASSFTTALQRVYLRAWRRPPGLKVGSYTRGLIWLVALLGYMTASGAIARTVGRSGPGSRSSPSCSSSCPSAGGGSPPGTSCSGHVRWRPLLPTAVISSVAMVGLRDVGRRLDARGGREEPEPVRLLRHRPGPRHLVLRGVGVHHRRGLRRAGPGRGHRRRSGGSAGVATTTCWSRAHRRRSARRSLRLRDAFTSTGDDDVAIR